MGAAQQKATPVCDGELRRGAQRRRARCAVRSASAHAQAKTLVIGGSVP